MARWFPARSSTFVPLTCTCSWIWFSHTPLSTRLCHPCVYLLSAKSIPHRCLCGIINAIFGISYTRLSTSWHSILLDKVFYVCDVGLCNSNSKFQTSIPPLYQVWVWIFLVRTKGTFWFQNYLLCWNFLFCSFTSDFSMSFIKLFSGGMWEKESIIDEGLDGVYWLLINGLIFCWLLIFGLKFYWLLIFLP